MAGAEFLCIVRRPNPRSVLTCNQAFHIRDVVISVRQTERFKIWFEGLRDRSARKHILVRIGRLERGNFGDVRPVGEGVSELRIFHGPGYRLYLVRRGQEIVILLSGGDKSSQARDIQLAKQLAADME